MFQREHLFGGNARRWLALASFVLCAMASGCNNSRYGVTYDKHLPGIRRVAIYPANINVVSLHTGGVEESRPDLEPDVRVRTIAAIRGILRERGFESVAIQSEELEQEGHSAEAKARALVQAISDAIVTHHYEYGNARTFDYLTGDSAATLAGGEAVDAVLCVYLKGAVPTPGRSILAGTAAVVGFVVALVPIPVKTNEAFIMLVLIDCRTGEVLWFNQELARTDVRGERRLRRFIKRACSYLLKPRK